MRAGPKKHQPFDHCKLLREPIQRRNLALERVVVAVDYEGDAADAAAPASAAAAASSEPRAPEKKTESKLDARIQSLIQLISNIQTMEQAMMEMNYDTRKAPLGKLTKQQIKAGYEALKEIEALVTAGTTSGLAIVDACNRFYTKIPHDFGYSKPPIINTLAAIQSKVTLLEALGEIEIAMKVLQDKTESEVHIVARGKGRALTGHGAQGLGRGLDRALTGPWLGLDRARDGP